MTPAVSFGILPQDRGTRSLFSIKQKRESQDSLVKPFPTILNFRRSEVRPIDFIVTSL
jgi:hypothetical protein